MTSSDKSKKPPRILSHYRLVRELGRGAMGVVYEGVDRRDSSTVAVKMLHEHLTKDRSFRERFEREAHIGVLLRSPYTVHLLDYGVQAGHYFIVMEFVEGQPLSGLLEAGPLPPARAVDIATQVARALEEAEARGIVHRDIKPDNIMVGEEDSVKVTDFGIARHLAGGTLTMAGAFIGTLSYAAPEQFSGMVDHRSDIWALGATLYDSLTGRPPFSGSIQEIAVAVREQSLDTRPLASVPPPAVRVVERCLQKRPEDRYQNAAGLAADLEHAARAMEATAPSAGAAEAATVVSEAPVLEATPSAPAEAPSREQSTTVVDVRGGTSVPAVTGFLGPGSYSVVVRNPTSEPTLVELRAEDTTASLEFELPPRIALAPGESKIVQVRAAPRVGQTVAPGHQFTILATGTRGETVSPQVPAVAAGPVSRRNISLLAVGGGLLALVAVVAVAVVLLSGGGDPGGGSTERMLGGDELADLALAPSDIGGDLSGFQRDFSGPLTPDILQVTACPDVAESGAPEPTGRYRVIYTPQGATPGPVSESTPVPGATPGPAVTAPPQSGGSRSSIFAVAVEAAAYGSAPDAAESVSLLGGDMESNPRLVPCSRYKPDGGSVVFETGEVGEDSSGAELGLTSVSVAAGAAAALLQEPARRLTAVRLYRSNLAITVVIGDLTGQGQREQALQLARRFDEEAMKLLSRSPAPTVTATPELTRTPTSTPGPTTTSTEVPSQGSGSGGQHTTRTATQQPPPITASPVTPPPVTPPPVTQPPVTEPPGPPANSVVAGEWDFGYYVTYNDCGFGNPVGTYVAWTIYLEEAAPGDGYITDGETVSVYDPSYDYYIDDFPFTYPVFEYTAPLEGGDSVYVYNEFYGPDSGYGARQEYYGYCTILLEE